MRAAVYHRFGGPEVVQVQDVPVPPVGPTEALVRVHASTVSAADRRARSLDVPAGLRLPSALSLGVRRPRRPVLGMDIAGTVAAVGSDVTRFTAGDEVIAMLGARFGGHAEYAVVDQDAAITAKPAAMGFEDAVTLVFGGITARAFLRQVALPPGARVLVNGASGAVGTAMVQLAHHAGAHVTAVCSGRNADLVTRVGADRVIDHTAADFTADDGRYDVLVDGVGNAPFPRVRHMLVPGGALLLVVADLRGLLTAGWHSRRSGRPVVTTPGPYRADDLAYLVQLADAGHYQPVRETTVDLDDITSAHRLADTGRKRGNVVVRIAASLDGHHADEVEHSRQPHTTEGTRS